MSVRPSSSGGPSSKSSFKFDKRMSRDDSFINTRHGARAGFKPHTLARGQLPTPETSPRASPPRKHSTPAVRMPTPESLNDNNSSQIGMALGSPKSKQSNGGLRTPQSTLRVQQTSNPAPFSPASGMSGTSSLPRKQSGKWKLFSRFGRKPSDHSLSTLNDQKSTHEPERTPEAASQHRHDAKVERSQTVNNRGTPRHKPIVVRSQTMPYEAESPAKVSGARPRLNEKRINATYGGMPTGPGAHHKHSGPLLDVEIPDITMERYSVMFGSVLQSQPSLLARRQATVQKLKSIDDAVEREKDTKHRDPSRRVTSPATGSPAFALFPPTPAAKKPAQIPPAHPSPRLRSNTSPALLRSPLQATFDHVTPSHQRQASNDGAGSHSLKGQGQPTLPYQKGRVTIATLARAKEQHPAPREFQFSPDSSNLILESPTDVSSPEFEVVKSESFRSKASYMKEPKWEMVSQPQTTPSTASSSAPSDRKPPTSSPATSTSNLSHISQDMDDLLEDTSNMNPVELSIARQISISRQQRKMLKPLQTSFSVPRTQKSPSKLAPVPRIAMGKDERLAETKSSTPTLVTPEETINPNLAQHRKSERVILERA
ncbi:hypothetical protein M426DRAFT_21156 [Hypoxylon sp. CI-4A]|nr:hypothetical protein M426DRAFT_21156 [Hypoxylon sp. CI-4A]